MNIKEKQQVRSSGLLTMMGLVALSLGIISVPWNKSFQTSQSDECRQKAEVVGYQVAQIFREASKNNLQKDKIGVRGPASVGGDSLAEARSTGTMGLDPWGQPYRYRILSADPTHVRILVWSAGPNAKVETAELDDESYSLPTRIAYAGDDTGIVLNVSHK